MLRLVKATKLYSSLGGAEIRKGLDNVNLYVAPGEFVTIIGSNGAGKSTLLNAVAGTVALDEGQIFIEDKDVTQMPEYRRASFIGRVFQDPLMGTAAAMTIEENLSLALKRGQQRRLKMAIGRKERELFYSALQTLGLNLETRLRTKVGLLSGGERQAVALIMATIARPKLLLLDEHTAALDPKTAERVAEITERVVRETRITTLMVTHNMEQALAYGNRLVMMAEGRIVLDLKDGEKEGVGMPDILDMFEKAGGRLLDDRTLLPEKVAVS